MNKTEDEAYHLIEEITLNNFQWSTKQDQPKRVKGCYDSNALTSFSAKVDAMTQRLDRMNINAVNFSTHSPYEICGSIEHVTLNYQVGSPFSKDPSKVNYAQNFNPGPAKSSTYNSGWKNHLNLSYRFNPNSVNMPPMNARVPP